LTARRFFIRATLSDNPDLARTNYASMLASLPEELRRAYRDGDFSVGIRDADFQVIPTAWVLAAEARWKPDGAHAQSDAQAPERWLVKIDGQSNSCGPPECIGRPEEPGLSWGGQPEAIYRLEAAA
jgi:hypothetical protein